MLSSLRNTYVKLVCCSRIPTGEMPDMRGEEGPGEVLIVVALAGVGMAPVGSNLKHKSEHQIYIMPSNSVLDCGVMIHNNRR